MEQSEEKVLDLLDELNIEYKILHHPPVETIEDMEKAGIFTDGLLCKNFFLRNANGKIHYVFSCSKDKSIDLVRLRSELGSSRLSFGSAERLEKHLGLKAGAVSPFGVINNEDGQVVVVFDEELKKTDSLVGFHPNVNTAFVWLKFEDMLKFINHCGNDVVFVKV